MQTIINNNPVWICYKDAGDISEEEILESDADDAEELVGFYFATCSPGLEDCYEQFLPVFLPDSSFFGPYRTEQEALKAADEFYSD